MKNRLLFILLCIASAFWVILFGFWSWLITGNSRTEWFEKQIDKTLDTDKVIDDVLNSKN